MIREVPLSRDLSLILLLIFYIGSVLLLYFGIVPYESRNWLLLVMTCIMIIYVMVKRFSLHDLGFTSSHLKGSLLLNGIFTLIVVSGLIAANKFRLMRPASIPSYQFFFLFYIFVSCPCQEFLYRSIVFAEFQRRKIAPLYFIIVSAINYTFLHVFYNDSLTLAVTLIGGLVWGYIYSRHPNFWGVAVSHILIGATSLLTGLV